MTAAFDAVRYKATTRGQWEDAARAWNDWGPTLRAWLGPATDTMLDMGGVTSGSRVLDVAAGAGDQTLQAAERVGPGGSVLATDLSPAILAFAADNARRHGFENVETMEADGEALDVPPGSFDAVISRVGMIYFPDQQKALAGMMRALRPGGKIAVIVYATAERNGFFSVPVSIIRRRAELPPPAAGQPGPFSLGGAGVLETVLRDAGFKDVESRVVDAPLRMTSAAERLRFEKESFGALHQMLGGMDDDAQEDAWREIESALEGFEENGAFAGPCELVIAAGTKP